MPSCSACVVTCIYWVSVEDSAPPLPIEVIIGYIVNLDVGDRTGKTALHHAAYNGHVEMLSLLLLKGANVKAQDRSERTPLHYAAFTG